jgi:hypothetical protein
MLEGIVQGTLGQLVERFRAFGDAGLRHLVPIIPSALVSPGAAAETMDALRTGEEYTAA